MFNRLIKIKREPEYIEVFYRHIRKGGLKLSKLDADEIIKTYIIYCGIISDGVQIEDVLIALDLKEYNEPLPRFRANKFLEFVKSNYSFFL